MKVEATFKWNEKARINLQKAPEKIMRSIARQTLDYTGTQNLVADSTGAPYRLPAGHSSGATKRTMYSEGVQGSYETGFYIGNFTDYAMYVYPRTGVTWTNPNTHTRWFEFIWQTKGAGIIDRAIKECKL